MTLKVHQPHKALCLDMVLLGSLRQEIQGPIVVLNDPFALSEDAPQPELRVRIAL